MHPQKDPRAALRLKDWMKNAGFVDIESRLLTLPMCPWSSGMPCMKIFEEKINSPQLTRRGLDPRDHDIGTLNAGIVSQLLYSMGLYPFTKMRE